MLALMPRCSACVLCGEAIQGKGRIDRIYCSASCRTLAWRARAGHRFDGRRKAKLFPQPGDFVARKALPLLAMRMRAELDAAKRRIAELEAQLDERRSGTGHAAVKVAGVATAVVAGAVGLAAALEQERNRVQQAEQESARAKVAAEQQRHQAELTAEREQGRLREAELQQQATALATSAEQATARERAAASRVATLRQEAEDLHQELADESSRIWKMHFELASFRGALSEAHTQCNRNLAAFLEESRQRQYLQVQLTEEFEQRRNVQLQLAAVRKQLGAERREWKTARAQLMHHAREGQHQLLADHSQLQQRLDEVLLRAETAERAMVTMQLEARQQERRYLERIEELQRKRLPDAVGERRRLSGKKEDKQLPARKKRKQIPEKKQRRQLPARSGILEKVAITVAGAVAGAVAGIGLGRRLGDDRKRLPPKEVGPYFEVIPVPERKRLPPKRD